jgi:hypothetical protein
VLESGDDNTPRAAAFANEFRIIMTEDFPSATSGFACRGLAQRIEAYHLVDSLQAAASFILQDLDDDQIKQLITFAVSQGSRDAANFAAMVLFSLLGMAQAQNDLRSFLREQLGDQPLAGLLGRCASPPPTDEKQLTRSGAFHAIFAGFAQSAESGLMISMRHGM